MFKDFHVEAVTSPPATLAGSASLYTHPKKQEGLSSGESPRRTDLGYTALWLDPCSHLLEVYWIWIPEISLLHGKCDPSYSARFAEAAAICWGLEKAEEHRMFAFVQRCRRCASCEQTRHNPNRTTGTSHSRGKLALWGKIKPEQDRKHYKYTCTHAYTSSFK